MRLEHIPLARQVEIAFRAMKKELIELSSGTVLIQIRNNMIGKFGIRHLPLEAMDGQVNKAGRGLTNSQFEQFRKMAIDSLKYKVNWTHGEILFDFMVKKGTLYTSIQFESNYILRLKPLVA